MICDNCDKPCLENPQRHVTIIHNNGVENEYIVCSEWCLINFLNTNPLAKERYEWSISYRGVMD